MVQDSKTYFDLYGERARNLINFTEISGRYPDQDEAERAIVPHISRLLSMGGDDDLLEIGCGVGNLLIPLSFAVKSATGVDHPDVIRVFRKRFADQKLQLIEGDFLKLELSQRFDCILIYSVLICLTDEATLFRFIDKACKLLRPNGKMLLGDINSIGRKERFLGSERGKVFQAEWERTHKPQVSGNLSNTSPPTVKFTDEMIMRILLHIRNNGFHSYLLEQPKHLPFGNTREDILVIGPEA